MTVYQRLARIIIERPTDLDLPPAPPPLDHSNASRDAELEHIRLLKRQQLEEAIKAKTSVNVIAPRSAASAPQYTGKPAVHRHARKHWLKWPECASRSMPTCVKTQPLHIMHALRTCGKDKADWYCAGAGPVSVMTMTMTAPMLLNDPVTGNVNDYAVSIQPMG